ncbi:MAG TPA: alpha/beta hydrolase [Steroidobacteraceae bacterium]|nr:alpha/beta hydrolase [Steroidobacteraceae bacterium]
MNIRSALRAESLVLEGPAGALEARLDFPTGGDVDPAAPGAFAVVCHPHPLFGGTLTNKVVHTLARAFNDSGIPSLRFNFRGVGDSAGTHDGGAGEVHDALAAVRYGRRRWPQAQLWLAGFSFGAAVALRACPEAAAAGLVAVAPAVDRMDIGMVSPACPLLVVLGDADDVVSPQRMLDWARGLDPAPALEVLAGAGHYFHGRLPELHDSVTAFLNQRPG